MTRYYFQLRDGSDFIPDDEGAEFASLRLAQAAAVDGIRSLISDDAKDGLVDLTGQIEIEDEQGNLQSVVSYTQAVEVRLPGSKP